MPFPNILYLHSHDTGRYVQPYGYAIPTPRIQRLADEGVVFRQAFCAAPSTSSASPLPSQGHHKPIANASGSPNPTASRTVRRPPDAAHATATTMTTSAVAYLTSALSASATSPATQRSSATNARPTIRSASMATSLWLAPTRSNSC